MRQLISILVLIVLGLNQTSAQFSFNRKSSKLISLAGLNHDSDFRGIVSVRYLPGVVAEYKLDTFSKIDLHFTPNITSYVDFGPYGHVVNLDLSHYRFYARYSAKQFEIRAGLQQIEFGPSAIFRPLQWFNQIDPRDPLRLTNGVWAVMGRYYFLNNANVWVWGMIRNPDRKGYEFFPSVFDRPEYGARIQLPTKKGEVALSYHHRDADISSLMLAFLDSPENRIGLDGKWDVGIGLWFEAAHNWKTRELGLLKHRTNVTVGADYTFGLGNGLNVKGEFLLLRLSEKLISDEKPISIMGLIMAYPFGMFDNLSAVVTYSFSDQQTSGFLTYEHQFKNISGYLMLSYTPTTQSALIQNDLLFNFGGPGIRVMAVYNH